MTKVSLFYLTANMVGGWATYTTHLFNGLKKVEGVDPRLYKINKTEIGLRDFGYDLKYRNLSPADAVKKTYLDIQRGDRVIIVALQKQYRDVAARMLDLGAWLVVHDPDEFANMKLVDSVNHITVRKAVNTLLPGSHLLLHPYNRYYPVGTVSTGIRRACSICRIDFDKKSHILLDANRLLPDTHKIHIRGFDNRLYSRLKLCPIYPEWKQSQRHFPRKPRIAVKTCHESIYSCDMSVMAKDGGGTQYSFLEAMDAGSVNILNTGWIRKGDEMIPYPNKGGNCITVADGQALADILLDDSSIELLPSIRKNAEALLARHDGKVIAERLLEIVK